MREESLLINNVVEGDISVPLLESYKVHRQCEELKLRLSTPFPGRVKASSQEEPWKLNGKISSTGGRTRAVRREAGCGEAKLILSLGSTVPFRRSSTLVLEVPCYGQTTKAVSTSFSPRELR
jgi:hypothetical protein